MRKKILFIVIVLISVFVININAQTQPENPSFEDWEDVGLPAEEPVNWSSIKTSDNTVTNPLAPVVWGKSTDAHSGSYSFKLFNVETIGSIIATGTATNGRVHADFNPENGFVFTDVNDPRWNTTCNDRPDSIVAWVKYHPEQNDVGKIRALLHTGYGRIPDTTMTNWIGEAAIDIVGQMDNWTRLSAPFVYFNGNTPEYILINMYSGNGTTPVKDSWVLIDDVALIYSSGGIKEHYSDNIDIYVQNNTIIIYWKTNGSTTNADMKIMDLSGRTVWTGDISSNNIKTIRLNAPKGVYICYIQSDIQINTRKLLIQ